MTITTDGIVIQASTAAGVFYGVCTLAQIIQQRGRLLPALHIVQETYGYVSHRAMRDVAELLEIAPSQVLDTATFYTHFWKHPKGKKVIVSCRSLSCELMGASEVNEAIARKLGVGEHGTSEDGAYSFVTEECLGACDHAPCLQAGASTIHAHSLCRNCFSGSRSPR